MLDIRRPRTSKVAGFLVLVVVTLALRTMGLNSFVGDFFTIIYVLMILLSKSVTTMYSALLVSIPVETLFTPTLLPFSISFYVIAAITAKLVIKNGISFRMAMAVILFCIFELCITIWTFADIKQVIKCAIMLLFVEALPRQVATKREVDLTSSGKWYVIGLFISSLTPMLLPNLTRELYRLANIGPIAAHVEGYISIEGISGLVGDSTVHAQQLSVGMGIVLCLMGERCIRKCTGVFLLLALMAFAALSLSKTAMILCAVSMVFLPFVLSGNLHGLVGKLAAIAMVYAVCVVLAYTYLLPSFLERVVKIDRGDFLTGRLEIWGKYLGLIKANPLRVLFGWGIGSIIDVSRAYMIGFTAHNAYLEKFIELGVCGLVLYVACFRAALKNQLRVRHIYSRNFPVIMLLLTYLVLGMVDYSFLYAFIPFSLCRQCVKANDSSLYPVPAWKRDVMQTR